MEELSEMPNDTSTPHKLPMEAQRRRRGLTSPEIVHALDETMSMAYFGSDVETEREREREKERERERGKREREREKKRKREREIAFQVVWA